MQQEGTARAIILNSGGANCFTGDFGYETTRLTAEAVAAAQLGAEADEILVCSTGLTGTGDEVFRGKTLTACPRCSRRSPQTTRPPPPRS